MTLEFLVIIIVFYDYPIMQTPFLDGVVILFFIQTPLPELRGKLAQYYFEIITLLIHLCTFILALQDTFPTSSETLRKVLFVGIMYLNTALVAGSLFFMGIEIYDIIRLKQEKKKASSTVQNPIQSVHRLTVKGEDIKLKPDGSLETSSNVLSENNNSEILLKPPRILDNSIILHDIETGGGTEIGQQQRVNHNRSRKVNRGRNRTVISKKKQQQQQMLDGLLLRNPTRHLRDFQKPAAEVKN